MKKHLWKEKKRSITERNKFLLLLLICPVIMHAQYNNLWAGQLKITNQKFVDLANPLPFGKDYFADDKYYIFEYDASSAVLYGFTEENAISSALRYNVVKKDNNSIVINMFNSMYDGLGKLNYHNVDIIINVNIETGLLSFSYFDIVSGKEELICTLKISQINIDVDKIKI